MEARDLTAGNAQSAPLRAAAGEIVTRYRRRAIGPAELQLIRDKIKEHGGRPRSRKAIATAICEAWGWRQPRGNLATRACGDLLLRLQDWGHVELPPIRTGTNAPRRRRPVLPNDLIALTGLEVRAGDADLDSLVVRPIRLEEREGWCLYMDRHHYLGYRPIVGEHLLYAAFLGDELVGLLGWASPALNAPLREAYVGWDETAKGDRLHLVADNVRFLVLPWVHVPHLASKILATNLRRLSRDWQQTWGHPIHLAETFVDTRRYRGTCYRASNWLYLGQTAGRSKRGNEYLREGSAKALFVYPLHRRAQRLLAGEPRAAVVTAPPDRALTNHDEKPSVPPPVVAAGGQDRRDVDAGSATCSVAIQVPEKPVPGASLAVIATAFATVDEGMARMLLLPTAEPAIVVTPAAYGAQVPEPPAKSAPSRPADTRLRALRGRKKTRIQIVLSDAEREAVERQARGLVIPHREVVRAKIILLLAAGGTPSAVAHEVGCARRIVHKWGERFIRKRLEGLVDDERSGRPPRFSPRSGSSPGQAGLRAP